MRWRRSCTYPRFVTFVNGIVSDVTKRNGEHQEVKFDNITKRIRVLCSGLDSKYVDAVPITQKVIEGVLYWDFHVRD